MLASGEHYAGDSEAAIVVEFWVGRSAVQHHLKLLREHGFALVRDEWPFHSYRLHDRLIPRLTKCAKRLKRRWDRRIGWNVLTDPLAAFSVPSARGFRGR